MGDSTQATSTYIPEALMDYWRKAMDAKDAAFIYVTSGDVAVCEDGVDPECDDSNSKNTQITYETAVATLQAAIRSDTGQALTNAARKYGPPVVHVATGNYTAAVQDVVVSEVVDHGPQAAKAVAQVVVPVMEDAAGSVWDATDGNRRVVRQTMRRGLREACDVLDGDKGDGKALAFFLERPLDIFWHAPDGKGVAKTREFLGEKYPEVLAGLEMVAEGRYQEGIEAVSKSIEEVAKKPVPPKPVQVDPNIVPPAHSEERELVVQVEPEQKEAASKEVAQSAPEPAPEETHRTVCSYSAPSSSLPAEEPPVVDAEAGSEKLQEGNGSTSTREEFVDVEEDLSAGEEIEDAVVEAGSEDAATDDSRGVAYAGTSQVVEEERTQAIESGTRLVDGDSVQPLRVSVSSVTGPAGERSATGRVPFSDVAQVSSSTEHRVVPPSDAGSTTAHISARLAAQRMFAAQEEAVRSIALSQTIVDGAHNALSSVPSIVPAGISSYVNQLVEQKKERDRQRQTSDLPQILFVFVHSGMLLGRQIGYSSLEDGVLVDLEQQERTHNLHTVASNTAASGQSDHSSSDATGIALDTIAAAIDGEISADDSALLPPVVILRRISPADTVVC